AFGGGAVAHHRPSLVAERVEHGAEPSAMVDRPPSELRVRRSRGEPMAIFLAKERVNLRLRFGVPGGSMGSRYREAAPVARVHGGMEDLQTGTVKDPEDLPQRIVLDVLVADGVVRAVAQHR